jgi:hypothetical protein
VYRSVASAAIDEARLPKTTKENGCLLLALVSDDNGSIHTTYSAVRVLFDVTSDRSIRRHLTELQDAEIIHYTTNHWIYVTFLAWPPVDVDNSQIARVRATMGAEIARVRAIVTPEDDGENTEIARTRATLRVHAQKKPLHIRNNVCLFVDPTLSLSKILDQQTNTQSAAYKLLTDDEIGIAPLLAADLAAGSSLEEIQRQVFAWKRDMAAGRVSSTGALITRIRKGFTAANPTEVDRESRLWVRHFGAYDKWHTDKWGEYGHLIVR